jgi:hypothetical protein
VKAWLGIAENAQTLLHIYPNPGNGMFFIVADAGQNLTTVQIFDVQGKLMENATLTQNGSILIVNLTGTETGMYFLQAMLGVSRVSERLSKQ